MSESASSQLITCPGGTFTGTIHHHAHGNVATYDPIVYGKLTSEFAPALHVYSPTESKDPAAHNNLRTQLHLTVTTPAHARKFNDLPVIAVIHGGGYDSGSRNEFSFDGTALAQTGVIVVSIDYRLGIQGFARFHDDPLITIEASTTAHSPSNGSKTTLKTLVAIPPTSLFLVNPQGPE